MDLPFQDRWNLQRLKRFRDRSLNNPQWVRDPDFLLSFLSHSTVPTADEGWPEGSPLAGSIAETVARVKDFRRYAGSHRGARRLGGDPTADSLWAEVKARVDALLREAEELGGRRL